jgi:hypothetical protein
LTYNYNMNTEFEVYHDLVENEAKRLFGSEVPTRIGRLLDFSMMGHQQGLCPETTARRWFRTLANPKIDTTIMRSECPTNFESFYDQVEGNVIALLGGFDRATDYLCEHNLIPHLWAYAERAHEKRWTTDITAERWFRKFAKKADRKRNKIKSYGSKIIKTTVTHKIYTPTKKDVAKALWRRLPVLA